MLSINAQNLSADFHTYWPPETCDPIFSNPSNLMYPWKVSHGSPYLPEYSNSRMGELVASKSGLDVYSEGVFISYEFLPGHVYDLNIRMRQNQNSGSGLGMEIYAANLNPKSQTSCPTAIVPDISSKQLILSKYPLPTALPGGLKDISITGFVVNSTKKDNLWIYSNQYIAGETSSFLISKVEIWHRGIETQPPTTPINLTVGSITTSSVVLSWGASTDNSAVQEYQIYRNNPLTLIKTVPASQTTTTLTNLTSCTSYQFKVRAKDIVGNLSNFSNIVQAIPLFKEPPLAITGSSNICAGSTSYYSTTAYNYSTYSWQVGPGLVLGATYGYSANVSGNSLYTGNSWVKVTRTMPACPGQTVVKSVTYPVYVGKPSTPTYIVGFPRNGWTFGENQIYTFSIDPQTNQGVNQYQWSVGGGTILSGQGTNSIEVRTTSTPPFVTTYFDVTIKVNNGCGWTPVLWRSGFILDGVGPINKSISVEHESPVINQNLVVYPNPAQKDITVLIPLIGQDNSLDSKVETFQISIIDLMGRTLKDILIAQDSNEVKLDISELKAGIYTLNVKSNSGWFTTKFIVK